MLKTTLFHKNNRKFAYFHTAKGE